MSANLIPREAIEKAIEAGWEPLKTIVVHNIDAFEQIDWQTIAFYNGSSAELGAPIGRVNIYRIALDPSFWQALGKSLACEKNPEGNRADVPCEKCDVSHPWCEHGQGWQEVAHRFYDLILTKPEQLNWKKGESIERFWVELFANQQ